MRYFLLFFVVSLLLLPASSHACDEVNTHFTDYIAADTYIVIGQEVQDQESHDCYGETLETKCTFDLSYTCSTYGYTTGDGYVWGNNLSGTYQVSESGVGCNTLCACTP